MIPQAVGTQMRHSRDTGDRVARYRAQGYLSVADFSTTAEVAALRGVCAELMAARGIEPATLDGPGTEGQPLIWIRCTEEERELFAAASQVLDRARELAVQLLEIDDDRICSKLRVFYKRPRSRSAVDWHQDEAFYQRFSGERPEGYRSVNFWYALDDASEANGTLKYIPGSHLEGLVEHEMVKTDPYEAVLDGQALEESEQQQGNTLRTAHVDESRSVFAEVPAGGINVHHCRTLHGSNDNESDVPRGAFVMIFQEKD